MSQLLSSLQWRYATKKFDATKHIPAHDWNELLASLVLTPSSFGLQPWKFLVIEDGATREKLKAASWGQAQVTDADKYLVFVRNSDISEQDIQKYVDFIASERNIDVAVLAGFRDMMNGALLGRSVEAKDRWAANQVYIALGQVMLAAAEKKIDACPLEGLDPSVYDAILGLTGTPWKTTCALALGYRASDDVYAQYKKVRFPQESIIQTI